MPYRSRAGTAGLVFHVLNRAVRRARLFNEASDYAAFLAVMREAQTRVPLKILAYCVMPNHFHLIVWPQQDLELSAFMRWMTATHSKRWHGYRGTTGTGSVYQGRYKSFPIQRGSHFLTVCRYVEQNALRAGLASRAEAWPWSSVASAGKACARPTVDDWPVPRPSDWISIVNQIPEAAVLKRLRQSVRRSAPFGDAAWAEQIAARLETEPTLEPIGRHGRTRTEVVSAVIP